MPPSEPSALSAAQDAELIGLRVIRLRHVGRRTGGVVRSFDAANKMLLDWSSRIKGTMSCEYEIVYVDGRVLNGLFSFSAKGPKRPSLTRHLRTMRSTASGLPGKRPLEKTSKLQAREQLPQLDWYELEDFAVVKRSLG